MILVKLVFWSLCFSGREEDSRNVAGATSVRIVSRPFKAWDGVGTVSLGRCPGYRLSGLRPFLKRLCLFAALLVFCLRESESAYRSCPGDHERRTSVSWDARAGAIAADFDTSPCPLPVRGGEGDRCGQSVAGWISGLFSHRAARGRHRGVQAQQERIACSGVKTCQNQHCGSDLIRERNHF